MLLLLRIFTSVANLFYIRESWLTSVLRDLVIVHSKTDWCGGLLRAANLIYIMEWDCVIYSTPWRLHEGRRLEERRLFWRLPQVKTEEFLKVSRLWVYGVNLPSPPSVWRISQVWHPMKITLFQRFLTRVEKEWRTCAKQLEGTWRSSNP